MKKISLIIITVMTLMSSAYSATQWDELDKAPEGAHKGQMILASFVSIGYPVGDVLDAEMTFTKDSTYTFPESEITKKMLVTHLAFSFGFSYEYMFFDYIGARARVRKSVIVQRTYFGPEYKNWSETLYSDYGIFLGPALHATNRKMWDVSLSPLAGYVFGDFTATPVAAKLLEGYTGNRKRSVNGFAAGAGLDLSIYFSGGFYLSAGFDWLMNMIDFGKKFTLVNPQTGDSYFSKKTSAGIHSLSLMISAGYAFSN